MIIIKDKSHGNVAAHYSLVRIQLCLHYEFVDKFGSKNFLNR